MLKGKYGKIRLIVIVRLPSPFLRKNSRSPWRFCIVRLLPTVSAARCRSSRNLSMAKIATSAQEGGEVRLETRRQFWDKCFAPARLRKIQEAGGSGRRKRTGRKIRKIRGQKKWKIRDIYNAHIVIF